MDHWIQIALKIDVVELYEHKESTQMSYSLMKSIQFTWIIVKKMTFILCGWRMQRNKGLKEKQVQFIEESEKEFCYQRSALPSCPTKSSSD